MSIVTKDSWRTQERSQIGTDCGALGNLQSVEKVPTSGNQLGKESEQGRSAAKPLVENSLLVLAEKCRNRTGVVLGDKADGSFRYTGLDLTPSAPGPHG
jgi:hypothetical protein